MQGYINEFVFTRMPDIERKLDQCLVFIEERTYVHEIEKIAEDVKCTADKFLSAIQNVNDLQ